MKLISRSSALLYFLVPIKQHYKLARFKTAWRKKNPHNLTQAKNIFPMDKVSCGNRTYGELEVYSFGGDSEGLQIGNYCSIAGNVRFLLGGEHPLNQVSTFPFPRHVYQKLITIPNSPFTKIKQQEDWQRRDSFPLQILMQAFVLPDVWTRSV